MGSSESKMSAATPKKPEPAVKNSRVSRLVDPRSPSTGIDRTPIQVGGPVPKAVVDVKSECPVAFTDPRSPSVGITRTPVREAMRATVGSFARRLGMLFHNDVEGKAIDVVNEEEVLKDGELGSTEPLLSSQPRHTFGSLALVTTPDLPPSQSSDESSPFEIIEEPPVQVEIESTEVDISLEEAEEARETPLHKRLSMSLITCHEGASSSQIFAEVHCDGSSPSVSHMEMEQLGKSVDHSYALPSITVEPESPVEVSLPTAPDDSPAPSGDTEQKSPEETEELGREESSAQAETPSVSSTEQEQQQQQLSTGIRCPTFDPKSPSQVVFKPQWLGKGFGATGLRAREVQGRGGKRGSSPLAVRVAVKNVNNENKRVSGKLKQKGTEGRSPLQILKETNSPRDQRTQMKLKVSTPDNQRMGVMDRRVLAVSLDKENR